MITLEVLQKVCPQTRRSRLELFVDPLNRTIEEYSIARVKEFIAQVGHESMGLVYTAELWGPTEAQKRYDSRADLGNTKPEAIDVARRHQSTPGRYFAGHGLIQVTGYDNHCAARDALGIDCVEFPGLLTEPLQAARSAGDFWRRHGCDAIDDFERLSARINGRGKDGHPNGLADRYAYFGRVGEALA